jgi:pterin-4a-carbinolamine dehydratase
MNQVADCAAKHRHHPEWTNVCRFEYLSCQIAV